MFQLSDKITAALGQRWLQSCIISWFEGELNTLSMLTGTAQDCKEGLGVVCYFEFQCLNIPLGCVTR